MIIKTGKYYLYRHIRLDRYEPFYIGIGTKDFKGNYYRSRTKSGRNNIWNAIVNKANYSVEILLESNNFSFIKKKEREFIRLYGRIDLKTGILANQTNGGDGDHSWNEERKINHSKMIKFKIKSGEKIVPKFWNNKFGKNHVRSKAILQLDVRSNKMIEEFECAREACRKYGFKPSTLTMALKRKNKTAYGYKWEYKN